MTPNVNCLTNTLDERFLERIKTNRPLFLTVGIYLFPDDLIRKRQINPFFFSGNVPEINRMAMDIVCNQEAIENRVRTNDIGRESAKGPTTITLFDVFQVVNPDNYPFLWDITTKAVTIFPTTVSCEQQFSQLRHRLHENMKKETSFAFLIMSQKEHFSSLKKEKGKRWE